VKIFVIKEDICTYCNGMGTVQHYAWVEFWQEHGQNFIESDYPEQYMKQWFLQRGFDIIPDEEVACEKCEGQGTLRENMELQAALGILNGSHTETASPPATYIPIEDVIQMIKKDAGVIDNRTIEIQVIQKQHSLLSTKLHDVFLKVLYTISGNYILFYCFCGIANTSETSYKPEAHDVAEKFQRIIENHCRISGLEVAKQRLSALVDNS